jgi:DNA-binding CsgD family transcriptional regulator
MPMAAAVVRGLAEAGPPPARTATDQMTRQPVPRGRILLLLGAVQRRLKQRRAARDTLNQALATFEGASAAIWADRAREELARVSGRPAGTGELTVTELRVAELIARGMSNRAAAAELFVSVRTVESTLTKIYTKLGVRSRTQLASYLRDQDGRTAPGGAAGWPARRRASVRRGRPR